MKNGYIRQAWLVLMLALCFGAALAGVQVALGERIDANKEAEILSQIPVLVPGAATGNAETIAGQTVYQALDGDGAHVGWVAKAAGYGFADRIELLIGLDPSAQRITGLYVLDQKETPALGSRIVGQDWRDQFKGKDASRALSVVKDGGQIVAVSGATISSRSVCDIVNTATAKLRASLVQAGTAK